MLYKFEQLENRLDQLRFPKIRGKSGFQIIREIDFKQAYKSGDISFAGDGIYLEYEGEKYRGYMFIKEYWVERYGTYPKFHLAKCKIIQEFIDSGLFKDRYEWSNSSTNDIIDKTTRRRYKNQNLECCGYCKRQLFGEIHDTTEGFFNSLDKSEIKKEVDIFGYVRDKEKISKAYRNKQDYTCENCSVKPKSSLHRKWWHVHHQNGHKTNNTLENLKCLCILCHSNVDAIHRENFKKGSLPSQIKSFKKEYQLELNG